MAKAGASLSTIPRAEVGPHAPPRSPISEVSAAELLRHKMAMRDREKEMKRDASKVEQEQLRTRLREEELRRLKQERSRNDDAVKARERELEQNREKLQQMREKREQEARREQDMARQEAQRASERQKFRDEQFGRPRPSLQQRVRNLQDNAAPRASVSSSHSMSDLETAWRRFVESPPDLIRLSDIPFPSMVALSLSRHPQEGKKKLFRDLAKRWHPDKFMQRFGAKIHPEERDAVEQHVKAMFQTIQAKFQ